jgi:hypothetical protein
MRVLFFVEGFTDIRFVVGLSEVCDLTLAVPARAFRESGLDERLRESGAAWQLHAIEGGRSRFSGGRCSGCCTTCPPSTSCWRRRCCAAASTPRSPARCAECRS